MSKAKKKPKIKKLTEEEIGNLTDNLNNYSVTELKSMLKERGIGNYSYKTKKQIIQMYVSNKVMDIEKKEKKKSLKSLKWSQKYHEEEYEKLKEKEKKEGKITDMDAFSMMHHSSKSLEAVTNWAKKKEELRKKEAIREKKFYEIFEKKFPVHNYSRGMDSEFAFKISDLLEKYKASEEVEEDIEDLLGDFFEHDLPYIEYANDIEIDIMDRDLKLPKGYKSVPQHPLRSINIKDAKEKYKEIMKTMKKIGANKEELDYLRRVYNYTYRNKFGKKEYPRPKEWEKL